jgi:hypothetical protein
MPLKLKNSIVYINKLMVFMCLCEEHLGNEKFKGFATFNPKNLSFDNEFQLHYINKLMVFMCLCEEHLGNEKFKGSATFNPKNLSFDNEFQLHYK